jgi:hypothetical protein
MVVGKGVRHHCKSASLLIECRVLGDYLILLTTVSSYLFNMSELRIPGSWLLKETRGKKKENPRII